MSAAKYLVPYILINGFVYVFAKDGLNYSSPFVYGATTGLVTFIPLLALSRGRLIINRDTVLFGVFFWISGVTWLVGLNLISPSQSAILSFTMPLFVIPLAALILRERTSRVETYGAVIGFTGITVYNIPLLSGTLTVVGTGLTMADAFFWALFSVYLRKLKVQDSSQTLVTGTFLSLVFYGVLSIADFRFVPSVNLAIDVAYGGGIGGALSIVLWMLLIKMEKLSRLTTLVFLSPIVTLIYGVLTTGILPGYLTLGGVALIFIGIYASSVLAKKREVRPPTVLAPVPVVEHEK